MWTPAYERRSISGRCLSSGQRKRRKYICVCTSLREYWWLIIVCNHRLTAKRKKKKQESKARIVFVRGATLIANTLRKHKPLCLCTYIYVSLTFIVFCKTTSRNMHNCHLMSQERRTRHCPRIEPKKVFRGNPRMDFTFQIPGTGLRIPCQGNLGFGGLATQAKLIWLQKYFGFWCSMP